MNYIFTNRFTDVKVRNKDMMGGVWRFNFGTAGTGIPETLQMGPLDRQNYRQWKKAFQGHGHLIFYR